jgi:hypothetical protein
MEPMEAIDEHLPALGERWRRHELAGARLVPAPGSLRFTLAGATAHRYTNAQIDDYSRRTGRRHFAWRPPVSLRVRARFSHRESELRGTAGFGFWNDPFLMTDLRMPARPQAIWFFFGSPPGNMKLDWRVPGSGWKAAALDAARPASLVLAPLAPLAVLLMNARPLYRALWPRIQRALRIREALLALDMTAWHTYELDWGRHRARFRVDGRPVCTAFPSPRGPLGLVVWMDNQYMVVTPQGRFRWGVLEVEGPQWMEIERLSVEPRPPDSGTELQAAPHGE